ncbi:Acetyl-CoA acetyltransferase [Beauveria bassiana D1-5]|uniref:acetyl-CoA C-acetyltransferase n=1 Tax=Beauveria bassiana D1-5 TaxID=1245745 RepID=A0A0A2WCS5_BEABA|nr:Acetyl-CoA acetyltransferase [Beauveria bassiana D1-5]
MPAAPLRTARLNMLAQHLAAGARSRSFSTGSVLRKEIQDAYILSAARTPTAKFNGSYLNVTAPQLGAVAIKSALEKSKVPTEKITDVYMGNVLSGSVGQAPARQAVIFAGLPETTEAITINKVCSSGLKAVVFAAQNIQMGLAEAQIAGGMENMSRVPYYINRSSSLPAFGHAKLEDGLIKDGLTDVYEQFHMGNCCENTVKKHNITREQQDEYAIQSYRNAQKAWADKAFAEEIAPVTVKGRKGDTVIDTDEGFQDIKFEKVPTLKPAFVRDGTGTVTAANSSTLNDGASALVLGNRSIAEKYGKDSRVLAKIVSYADAAMAPIDFPIAPAKAVPIALERAGITKDQVAVWEFNEAFAGVILANQKILGLEGAKVNPLGGAISLGHALGSSGSRILTTLLHQLKPGEYGVAAICNGGGAATAMVVQRVDILFHRKHVYSRLSKADENPLSPFDLTPTTSQANNLFPTTIHPENHSIPPHYLLPASSRARARPGKKRMGNDSLVREFLGAIREQVRQQQGDALRAWLQVDSTSDPQYFKLAAELRSSFTTPTSVDDVVEACLPQEDNVPEGQATAWPGFQSFIKDYLVFWRDIDFDDLAAAHQRLAGLVNSCATAFAHPSYGGMLLQASMSLSEMLARLTLMLNRRPDLMRKLRAGAAGDEDKSIAESSAEIIQKIFTTCLTDRSSPRCSRPEGKKTGVYMFANLVLKLLFACRRTHLARMIFVNIASISPPLRLYPAAQRVTFLYYLGRFNFANHHARRAALCLEAAYRQTPAAFRAHRARILTGRRNPDPRLPPLCRAVRAGHFVAFQAHLATHERWLLERGLLLPLASRLRPLLWRSLSRRAFLLTYVPPPPAEAASSSRRAAATLDLTHLHTLAVYTQRRLEGWLPARPPASSSSAHHRRPPHGNQLLMRAVSNSVVDNGASTLAPPPGGPRRLRPNEGLVWGNAEVTYEDVEMVVAALVQMGLLHGFVAHGQSRFAIIGAKAKGSPLLAGWPDVWQAIQNRKYDEDFDLDHVPGWVKA